MSDCKKKFSNQEANRIRELLEKKGRATRTEQKSIRAALRRMGFNISCFRQSGTAFDHLDFDSLVRNGSIKILDTSDAVSKRSKISHSSNAVSELEAEKLRRRREELRQSFKPTKVKTLFIGESPPAGNTFFYNGNSKLYQCISSSFQAVFPSMSKGPDKFLKQFSEMGCYLDDLCIDPVNKLSEEKRIQARKRGIPGLSQRISILNPAAIICVMKAISSHVNEAIQISGISLSYSAESSFPAFSTENEVNCINENMHHLNEIVHLGILDLSFGH